MSRRFVHWGSQGSGGRRVKEIHKTHPIEEECSAYAAALHLSCAVSPAWQYGWREGRRPPIQLWHGAGFTNACASRQGKSGSSKIWEIAIYSLGGLHGRWAKNGFYIFKGLWNKRMKQQRATANRSMLQRLYLAHKSKIVTFWPIAERVC